MKKLNYLLFFALSANVAGAASIATVFAGRHGADWKTFFAKNPTITPAEIRTQLEAYYDSLPDNHVSQKVRESILVEYGNFAVEEGGQLASDADKFYSHGVGNLSHMNEGEAVAFVVSLQNAASIETATMINHEIEHMPSTLQPVAADALTTMYMNVKPDSENAARTDAVESPQPNLYAPLSSRPRAKEWIKVTSDSAEVFARLLANSRTSTLTKRKVIEAQKMSFGFLKNSPKAFSTPDAVTASNVNRGAFANPKNKSAAARSGSTSQTDESALTSDENPAPRPYRWLILAAVIAALVGFAFWVTREK